MNKYIYIYIYLYVCIYVLLFSFSQSITDDTGRPKKKERKKNIRGTRIQGSRRPRGGTIVRAPRPLDLSYKSESSCKYVKSHM